FSRNRKNTNHHAIFCFTLDGVKVCHLGDLGQVLSDDQIAQISTDQAPVHVLLTPVGGTYSLNAVEAWALAQKMKPNIVIPMHFRNPKVDFHIAPVDDFLKGKEGVKRLGTSEVEVDLAQLPALIEIWVLNPAL
ncbi:MAG: MBL fold metallo-hydrolase, partial [Chloroflexota bacterium]